MNGMQFLNPIDRRKFLKSAAAAGAGAGALGAFGSDAKAQAKELRILMAGGTWKDWVNGSVVEPFVKEKKAEVVWRLGLTHEPMVMAQRRNPQWDLIHINQNRSTQLGAMNLLMPFAEDRLPNLKKIHPSFRYEFIAGKVHTPYGMAVNTKQITKPVDSWLALWDPAYKGKVAFPAWNWVGDEVFHAINGALGGSVGKHRSRHRQVQGTVQGEQLQDHQQCRAHAANDDRGRSLDVPAFRRPHRAHQAGRRAGRIRHAQGRRPELGVEHGHHRQPAESRRSISPTSSSTMSLSAESQVDFCRKHGYPPTNMELMANLPADLKKLEFTKAQLEGMGKLQRAFDYVTQFAYRDQHAERWNKEVLAPG